MRLLCLLRCVCAALHLLCHVVRCACCTMLCLLCCDKCLWASLPTFRTPLCSTYIPPPFLFSRSAVAFALTPGMPQLEHVTIQPRGGHTTRILFQRQASLVWKAVLVQLGKLP